MKTLITIILILFSFSSFAQLGNINTSVVIDKLNYITIAPKDVAKYTGYATRGGVPLPWKMMQPIEADSPAIFHLPVEALQDKDITDRFPTLKDEPQLKKTNVKLKVSDSNAIEK